MALQEKKIMPPPWLAHREIERYSIGWRMGYGEDYIYRFGDWLDTLSPEERTEYRTLFPEPVTWKGWWDDEEEPFLNQWNRLNQTLEETGKRKQSVWLMGDFNSPAEVRGQGYDLVCRSGWQDTYVLAEKKDGGITARPEIDGWKDRRSSGREKQETGMRLDYLFCSRPVHVAESRVVCSGKREPVVSDHYGVIIETENWEVKE